MKKLLGLLACVLVHSMPYPLWADLPYGAKELRDFAYVKDHCIGPVKVRFQDQMVSIQGESALAFPVKVAEVFGKGELKTGDSFDLIFAPSIDSYYLPAEVLGLQGKEANRPYSTLEKRIGELIFFVTEALTEAKYGPMEEIDATLGTRWEKTPVRAAFSYAWDTKANRRRIAETFKSHGAQRK